MKGLYNLIYFLRPFTTRMNYNLLYYSCYVFALMQYIMFLIPYKILMKINIRKIKKFAKNMQSGF